MAKALIVQPWEQNLIRTVGPFFITWCQLGLVSGTGLF